MGSKTAKLEALLREMGLSGQKDELYYAGYFECFNRQLFYEAHEALEEIWLPVRQSSEGNFYKGLIQLAGAFVHLQKGKHEPACRLFRLARENLAGYPGVHQRLDLDAVRALIDAWLERTGRAEPYAARHPPHLELLPN